MTRGTCAYGWEAQLPVRAGYLGIPKAEVPHGTGPDREVAWDHFRFPASALTTFIRVVASGPMSTEVPA